MVFLGSWNSEVFAATTDITGIIIGLFVGKKHRFLPGGTKLNGEG